MHSVLIVEPNPYHSEILPGFTKYFHDLGFDVTILARRECLKDGDPFAMYSLQNPKLVRHYVSRVEMKDKLTKLDAVEYDYIFISSTSMWEKEYSGPYLDYLGFIPKSKYGALFVEHNLSAAEENYADFFLKQNSYFCIMPQKFHETEIPAINPHFFGSIVKPSKRTNVISVVGSFSDGSKNMQMLYEAIRTVSPILRDKLKVELIGSGDFVIPGDLKRYIKRNGRLEFQEMYKLLIESDYIMPLLDSANPVHYKYANGTTTGSLQLSLGFLKPLIIEDYFVNSTIYNKKTIIKYEKSNAAFLADAIETALNLSDNEYENMRGALEVMSKKLYSSSLNNLKGAIDNMREQSEAHKINQLNTQILSTFKNVKILEEKAGSLIKENENLTNQIEILKAENYKLYQDLENTIHSRRFTLISKFARIFNNIFPPRSLRRKSLTHIIEAFVSIAHINDRLRRLRIRLRIKKLALSQEQKTVIVYVTMPWDHHLKQRPHHLMRELSKKGVFSVYVDETIDEPRFINSGLVILPKREWQYYIGRLTNQLNCYYMTAAHYPITFEELMAIEAKGYKLIYEYIDDLDEAIFGNLDKQKEVFKKLIDLNPSLIIASARRLYEQMVEIFPDGRVILNENAVNMTHFKPQRRVRGTAPRDIAEIISQRKPIVGYYGAIAPWLDYELIAQAARDKRDYNFVFIGPDYHGGLDKMPGEENIYLLGPKKYDELPKYSNWFDCAIIPFEEGDIAKATSPVKLFEYMAMGIPTVCTKDLNECKGYDGVIVANSREGFIESIDKAIKYYSDKKIRSKLQEYASKNTWGARASDIVNSLRKIEGDN